jgi:carboxyl-terminal processing protease
MKYNNKPYLIIQPLLLAGLFILGLYLGIQKQHASGITSNTPSSHALISSDSNVQKLLDVINYVKLEYVDTINEPKAIEKAINALLQSLDPHSVYIPAPEAKSEMEQLSGKFEGIGIQFSIQNDTVRVVAVISGGPAEKAGLLPGDCIVTVDDSSFTGKSINNNVVMKTLKGPRNTKIKLGILRNPSTKIISYTLTRDVIPFYSIDASFSFHDIGYLKINRFAQTTHDEFRKDIAKLHAEGISKFIIDLRGNPGGYMDAAIKLADEFLPAKKLIVYTKGRAMPKRNFFATAEGSCENDAIIVLIDSWSASASEIFAGAIQDNDRGIIIGRRSFGKGLVQSPIMFKDGSSLRLTVARYYSPTGRCIQRPYGKNVDDYYKNITSRFVNGEVEAKDSIHFPDSLKYKTPKGTIVYGGGGIMPNIFVPLDTSFYDSFYMQVSSKNLLYNFAYEYADAHRKELMSYKYAHEIVKHIDSETLWNRFLKFCQTKQSLTYNPKTGHSKEKITNTLKAFIIRNLIGDNGFYEVYMQSDKDFLKATEYFSQH